MARTKTTLKKGDNLPPRGKGFKTLMLDGVRKEALLGLDENATNDEVDMAILSFMARAAFSPTKDTALISGTCLTLLAKRRWPNTKPIDEKIDFEYNPKASLKTRVKQVSDATCSGILPANIGQALLSVLASETEMIKVLDSEERIKKLEAFQRKSESEKKAIKVEKVEEVEKT